MIYTLTKPNKRLEGVVKLAGSKSISNRALIIRALCPEDFSIHKIANAKDTDLLLSLLESKEEVRDAGPAGTTFRFMTAYLSLQPGVQILTGSERMKQRPIGVLVDALRTLGANIEYLEQEGYPPLKIDRLDPEKAKRKLEISAGVSSQYISALLLIAPTLPKGLQLTLKGKIVSRPYIEMTLNLMRYFGVSSRWEGNLISIPPQNYKAKDFTVEADWSAASYYYAMACFADDLDLQLDGLFEESVQGDSVLAEMMTRLGIQTDYNQAGIRLRKLNKPLPAVFEWDFILCPDLAQTLSVVCANLGLKGVFSGLETLRIKETDRIAALQVELAKIGVQLQALDREKSAKSQKEYFQINGRASWRTAPRFETYEDHRMAMAFAPLAMSNPIQIEDPLVVQKSYPDFWSDLQSIGFVVS